MGTDLVGVVDDGVSSGGGHGSVNSLSRRAINVAFGLGVKVVSEVGWRSWAGTHGALVGHCTASARACGSLGGSRDVNVSRAGRDGSLGSRGQCEREPWTAIEGKSTYVLIFGGLGHVRHVFFGSSATRSTDGATRSLSGSRGGSGFGG